MSLVGENYEGVSLRGEGAESRGYESIEPGIVKGVGEGEVMSVPSRSKAAIFRGGEFGKSESGMKWPLRRVPLES